MKTKRTIAMLFAALLALAACGGPAGPSAAGPEESQTALTEAPTDAAGPTTGEAATTNTEAATEVGSSFILPKTNREAIDLYAAAVAHTLELNPAIHKRVVKVIDRPLSGDDSILKLLKISIAGFGVEKVICQDLMGEGDTVYEERAKTGLQPCWLQESDVTGFTAEAADDGIRLTIFVKDCTNPAKPWLKQGSSPIGNVTWDFTNLQDIYDGMKEAEKTVPGLKINIGKVTTNFYDGQVRAVIRPDLTFASLVHTAGQKVRIEDVDVRLIGIRLGGGEWGGGTGVGTITYRIPA